MRLWLLFGLASAVPPPLAGPPWAGVAVIVEPRRHPQLAPVVALFAARLGPSWRLHLVHGTRNADLAQELADEHGLRLATTNLGVSNLVPKDVAYNRLLTSLDFWCGEHASLDPYPYFT